MIIAGKCVYRSRLFLPDSSLGSRDRLSTGVVQSAPEEFEHVGAGELDVEDVCRTRRCGVFIVCWGFGRCVVRQLARWFEPEQLEVVEVEEPEVKEDAEAQCKSRSRRRTLLTPPVLNGPLRLAVTHREAERRPARGYMSWIGIRTSPA